MFQRYPCSRWPGPKRTFVCSQFPMGPGPDGPMGGMGSMEPHHMNGSLGERATVPSSNTSNTFVLKRPLLVMFSFSLSQSFPIAFVLFVGSGDMDGLPKVSKHFLFKHDYSILSATCQ